jgi:hypothetical protein
MNEPIGLKELPNSFEGHMVFPRDAHLMKEVLDIIKPLSILEIGFNVGHSALGWLTWSKAYLVCVDKGFHNWKQGVKIVYKYFNKRFKFIRGDSRRIKPILNTDYYDLVFIDGGHTTSIIENDINLSLDLNIAHILFDDFSGYVKKIVKKHEEKGEISLIKEWDYPRQWGLYKNENR